MFVLHNFSRFIISTFIVGLAASGCSRKTEVAQPPAQHVVVSTSAELATIAEDEAPSIESKPSAESTEQEKQQTSLFFVEFNPFGTGVAYIAKVGELSRVVHNGKPGKLYQAVQPNSVRISPDGKRVVYAAKTDTKVVVVLDGKEIGTYDEVAPPVFSPDGRHVAYEGKLGDKWHIFMDGQKSAPALSFFDKPVFNADSTKIMLIENTENDQIKRIVICDLTFKVLATVSGDAQPCVVSSDKSHIAVVTATAGKKWVSELKFDSPDSVKKSTEYDSVGQLTFNHDGSGLAYVAKKGADSFLVLNGKEEKLPAGVYPSPPVIRPDNKGAGIVVVAKDGAYLHQAFFKDGIASKRYKEAAELTYSPSGNIQAFGAIKNEKFLVVVNGVDGPFYDRVLGPRFSPDGNFLVYRARKDNMRFIVVADSKGTILRQHTGYERVFEPVFTADGKSVAYGVKDGKKLLWKVEKL